MAQSEDPIYRITAQPMDSLGDLLARVRTHGGRPVYLTVPAHSPLFLTASEFRALRETVRAGGINLTLISDDPHRRDYAQLFNLIAVEQEPGGTVSFTSPPPTQPAAPTQQPSPIDPALGQARQRRTLGARAAREGNGNEPDAWSAPGGWPVRPAPASGGDQRTQVMPTGVPPETPSALVPVPAVELIEPPRNRRRWPWFVSLVLLLVIALAGAGLLVPQATVTLIRQRTPLTADVIFAVSDPDTGAAPEGGAFTVPGARQQANVTVSVTLPATGSQNVPGQPASGEIVFANPTTEPITLPAGTEITSDGGIVFTLDGEVTVPAATDDVSGNATGQVTAVAGGAAANLRQGALSGRLDQGVYFSNREAPLTGGTDRTVRVVSEADIASAVEHLEQALPVQLAAALSESSGEAVGVAPGTVEHPPLNVTTDVEAGAEAEQVTATATTDASALTYRESDALPQAAEAALNQLSVPVGTTLDPASATIAGPASPVEGDATGTLVRVPVNIPQVSELDSAAIDDLEEDLAGKDREEAERIAGAIEGVESVDITVGPDWLPEQARDRMPFLPQRIEVETQ
jgi:hypothetical protein